MTGGTQIGCDILDVARDQELAVKNYIDTGTTWHSDKGLGLPPHGDQCGA